MLFKKQLKRKEIENKLLNYNKKEFDNEKGINNYLNFILNYLSNYKYKTDANFILSGRKKFIYNEIIEVLEGTKRIDNPIKFALGLLKEFICNDNFINPSGLDGKELNELRNKNDVYISKGYICLEEKQYIEEIINNIKKKNNFNKTIDELLIKIKDLPSGTEASISSLLGNDSLDKYSEKELNEITTCIWKRCEVENILLEFPNNNEKTGLIYNISFIKK